MTLENLAWTCVGMPIGFVVSLFVRARWIPADAEDDGRGKFEYSLNRRWQRPFFILVGVLALVSVFGTAVTNSDTAELTRQQQQQVARQTFCNRELIRVIKANAAVAQANSANLDELLGTIGQQVLNPLPDRDARTAAFQDAFRRYQQVKAANEAERKPYPEPNCGE